MAEVAATWFYWNCPIHHCFMVLAWDLTPRTRESQRLIIILWAVNSYFFCNLLVVQAQCQVNIHLSQVHLKWACRITDRKSHLRFAIAYSTHSETVRLMRVVVVFLLLKSNILEISFCPNSSSTTGTGKMCCMRINCFLFLPPNLGDDQIRNFGIEHITKANYGLL